MKIIPVAPRIGALPTRRNNTEPLSRGSIFVISCLFLGVIFSAQSLFAFVPPSSNDKPDAITLKGREIRLKDLQNPLRDDSTHLKKYIQEGGEIYFKNCYLCHGDLLDGKGIFGDRFFPAPANFRDPLNPITEKPESYTFWRIMKGGKGLPEKFEPWDSAMPAWEDTLTAEQAWKVILYIYENAVELWQDETPDTAEPSVEKGKTLYMEHCAFCHGKEGKGDGPAAPFSSPKPRKFSKGQYKIRTTPFGKIPTDEDLFIIITRGMPGTTMPGWKHLPASDRWSLVAFLKTLTTKFEKFRAKGKVHQPVVVPDPPPFTLESVARGKTKFLESCSGCHGVKGRNDGESTKKIVNIASDAIWPRNLSKPWTFRRGSTREDLFTTIRTGLSGTAMPRTSQRFVTDSQLWDIVNFVQTLSLSAKPKIKRKLKVARIDGEIPLNPDDPLWRTINSYFIPLGGQLSLPEKSFFPMVDSIIVKPIHNGNEIAFLVQWDDPSFDPILKTLTLVEESPPPPLPAHLQALMAEEEETIEEKPEPAEIPDALALQFPVKMESGGVKPHFLNGDPNHPVNMWVWKSYPYNTREFNAHGAGQLLEQPEGSQGVSSRAIYRYGQYKLVVKRKMATADPANDIQFQGGQTVPIAFNVWEGKEGEKKNKKAVSSWFDLNLE